MERLGRLAASLSGGTDREAALVDLRELAELARGKPEGSPLRLVEIDAAVGSQRAHLELLILPSIFAPEAWAYTFLEGLLELPSEQIDGRSLVEVGTGSGWIPIALAKFTGLRSIHGVDLNPQSPAVATCNAWLNLAPDEAARLAFSSGDLLRDRPTEERWDFVVGCIPQVLRTEPAEDDDLAIEDDDAEARALYDLSNYTAIQNVYEDHFGLGLIARLLDECPERLRSGGQLVLNLAGRPGRPIIERMFSRRGFSTEVLVARRVQQASDTDIGPLVALEERTQREFEFYLQQHSPEPIRAATALGWLAHGNPIWHEVAVWRAELRFPRETLALRRSLRALGSEALLSEIDLGHASHEQLDFVSALADRLAAEPCIPYAHEAGDPTFRRLIASYLERYFELRLGEDEIFVGPERQQTIYSLLLTSCDPGDGVLVTRNVHAAYAGAIEKAGASAIVTNNTLREVRRLIGAFDVKLILLAVEPEERSNLAALREIVDEAAARGILVVIDESAFFTITSRVEPRTLFEFLAREPHRSNLVVLYGLVKNAVQPDFELTLLLPVPSRLQADLEIAAEVTYSRISTPLQWFYERIFADLLSFRISFGPPEPPPSRPTTDGVLPRSRRIAEVANQPAFAPPIFRPDDPELIRLDYGENEYPIPQPLIEGLIAACAAPPDSPPAHGLEEAVGAFLQESRGASFAPREIALAQGVWPLIHDAATALHQRLGRPPRIYVATPCYGILIPTLLAAGCEVEAGRLASLLDRLEALSAPGDARSAPATNEGDAGSAPDAVFISQPCNPTGCYLPPGDLRRLAEGAVRHGVLILADEIFGLVDLDDPTTTKASSTATLERLVPGAGQRIVIFGGLSKEFAAGGLRVGWLASRDQDFVALVGRHQLGRLQLASARAASHLYGAFARAASGKPLHPDRLEALCAHLDRMRHELVAKRALLTAALPWDDAAPPCHAGGLFLAPDIRPWLGRTIDGITLDEDNLPTTLYEHTHVVVNSGAWCSDPHRIRAVFSLPLAKLEEAARRIDAFRRSLRE